MEIWKMEEELHTCNPARDLGTQKLEDPKPKPKAPGTSDLLIISRCRMIPVESRHHYGMGT